MHDSAQRLPRFELRLGHLLRHALFGLRQLRQELQLRFELFQQLPGVGAVQYVPNGNYPGLRGTAMFRALLQLYEQLELVRRAGDGQNKEPGALGRPGQFLQRSVCLVCVEFDAEQLATDEQVVAVVERLFGLNPHVCAIPTLVVS